MQKTLETHSKYTNYCKSTVKVSYRKLLPEVQLAKGYLTKY